MAKSMHEAMNDLGIRVCPICGREYTEHPSISRKDNKTEICPRCGIHEALDGYINANLKGDITKDPKYCIFEKRICRFADNRDGVFNCKAPNDFAMPCK